MALSTSTNTGGITSQTSTQSPQTVGQPAAAGAKAGNVQPGTATSLLTDQQGGIALYNTALPAVSLNQPAQNSPSSSMTAPNSSQPLPKYHVNTVWLIFPAILVLIAVISFWAAKRSVKNTTE